MPQLPDAIRPYAIILQKIHFWILAALVPLILLPLLFMAQSSMSARVKAKRTKIEGSIKELEKIVTDPSKKPHPNEKWSAEIEKRSGQINDETLKVWTKLWEDQKPLRQWPTSLGPDFVAAASALKPNASLRRALLERYQNGIRPVVRQLPGRMGADELMTEAAAAKGAAAPDRGAGGIPAEKMPSLLQWSPDDQQQLYASFDWQEPPSTTQVVLAQEELWMYGVLCDVIAKVNKTGTNPSNIPIPLVQQLKVGFPAAEDDPGGRSGKRILRIQTAGASGLEPGMPPPDMMMGPEAGGAGNLRPPHPRFSGAGAGPRGLPGGMPPGMMPGEPGAEAAALSPDDALKGWVYVDLDGKPLTAADLAAAPQMKLVKLMPYVLRITIDQRSLDALLVELATAPVPIDTRQVRINPDGATAAATGGGPGGGPANIPPRPPVGAAPVGGDRPRLHDVQAELRGTLAIAMRPDPSLLQGGEAGDGAARKEAR